MPEIVASNRIVHETTDASPRHGKTYEDEWVHVFTFQDDKIIRFREFHDTLAMAEAWRPL
jgi:ketosteroid isomerase-like protein